MNEKIEQILHSINELDTVIWLLHGKAVQHQDTEMQVIIQNLKNRHERIFQAVAELKKRE